MWVISESRTLILPRFFAAVTVGDVEQSRIRVRVSTALHVAAVKDQSEGAKGLT